VISISNFYSTIFETTQILFICIER